MPRQVVGLEEPMQIELTLRGGHRAERQPWLAWLRQRLQQALRRFRHHVVRVWVSLDDVNGPRGGRDKRCALHVATRDGHRWQVSEQTESWHTAFAQALGRAAELLRRRHAFDLRVARGQLCRRQSMSCNAGDSNAQLLH